MAMQEKEQLDAGSLRHFDLYLEVDMAGVD